MSIPVVIYRLGNSLHNKGLKKTSKIISFVNRFFFSVWLPSSARIGRNFTLGYWGLGVVIHSNTEIGNNCLISQNVTIGRNFGDKKVPIIGDDVYIGAGSVIFGEITIGDNVIIGSNSLVNKSISNNCTVVGNPMRVIANDRRSKYYEIDKELGAK